MDQSDQSFPSYARFSTLLFDRPADGVLQVTIDSARRLLDETMHDELGAIWRVIDEDPVTKVALIVGSGESFCRAAPPHVFSRLQSEHSFRMRYFTGARSIVYNLLDCSKPIVSAIHGSVSGAALAVAVLSDVTVAARSARLIDSHVRNGVAAGDHPVISWPLLCGMAKAKYHLLTSEPITGEMAAEMGLLAFCVNDGQERIKALEVAATLANRPAESVALTKRALNNWYRQNGPLFETSLAMEFLGMAGDDFGDANAAT